MARTFLVLVLLTLQEGLSVDFENVDLSAILSNLELIQGPALVTAYNQGLDAVLDFLNQETTRSQKTEIQLPDIEEDFSKKVWFAMVRGTFYADHGVLADLGTVRRMGDTLIERQGNAYKVTVVVGLGVVRLTYGHYLAKLGRRGPSVAGHLNGQVGTNAIRASATISFEGAACAVVLNEVKVVDLEGLGINVRGSGFGPLNWILTTFASRFARNNRGNIIDKLEKGLTKLGTNALSKIHCKPN